MTHAAREADCQWLVSVAFPVLRKYQWGSHIVCDELIATLSAFRKLKMPHITDWATPILDPSGALTPAPAPPSPTTWDLVKESWGARLLASFLHECSKTRSGTEAVHRAVADSSGLPPNPSQYTPSGFLSLVSTRAVSPGVFRNYITSSSLARTLDSKLASLPSMVSALRLWAKFCSACDIPHFPITPCWAARFAGVCREVGTYRSYLGHLRSACEFFGISHAWADSAEVRRAKVGLEKQALVYKGPRQAVPATAMARISAVHRPWHAERFFVVFAWVFMLRAHSEAANLIYSDTAPELTNFYIPLPEGVEGLCGRAGDCLVIRLRSRKSCFQGDAISRSCVCAGGSPGAPHVSMQMCPIHTLWVWLNTFIPCGSRVFPTGIHRSAQAFLRIALAACDVEGADSFTLHSLRRGSARDLVAKGGNLALLLKAAGWRSNAFKSYLDMMGVESEAFTTCAPMILEMDDP